MRLRRDVMSFLRVLWERWVIRELFSRMWKRASPGEKWNNDGGTYNEKYIERFIRALQLRSFAIIRFW